MSILLLLQLSTYDLIKKNDFYNFLSGLFFAILAATSSTTIYGNAESVVCKNIAES